MVEFDDTTDCPLGESMPGAHRACAVWVTMNRPLGECMQFPRRACIAWVFEDIYGAAPRQFKSSQELLPGIHGAGTKQGPWGQSAERLGAECSELSSGGFLHGALRRQDAQGGF